MDKKVREELYETVYHAAQAKGALAATAHTPQPMQVEHHANPMDDASPIVQRWDVDSGVCGFAWVVVRPGTSSFARWLTRHKYAEPDYYGGVSIWIRGYGRSYERKVAHAHAMANYLRSIGIRATAGDRLD